MKTTTNILLNNAQTYHRLKTKRSKNHQLGSYELNKVSLYWFNDKCHIKDCGISLRHKFIFLTG